MESMDTIQENLATHHLLCLGLKGLKVLILQSARCGSGSCTVYLITFTSDKDLPV